MTDADGFILVDSTANAGTADVVRRFIAAFQHKDPAAIPGLVAPDCVMEAMHPAPEGMRVEGREANIAFWQAMVQDPGGVFEVEDVVIAGDRAVNRWRYRFGKGAGQSVRGVTLLRVQEGKICEALGYGKTMPGSEAAGQATAQVIERFNEAFHKQDPSLLLALVAPDCVVENSNPAPDGSRHEGRDACLALWGRIATLPGTRFETEDVAVAGEQATIRWRLHYGPGAGDNVRGINLMRVRGGQIVEAYGYVKGA